MRIRQLGLLLVAVGTLAMATPVWAADSNSNQNAATSGNGDNPSAGNGSNGAVGDNPSATDPAPGCVRGHQVDSNSKTVCPTDPSQQPDSGLTNSTTSPSTGK